ncbi:MAG: response regulator [Fidelibacterota bacterium]|nr:MAG: response regulator [Candidatus Neomarinimicrobiota bacterium]
MDEMQHLFLEALKAHIDALEASSKALQTQDPDALNSIRRIAHTLKGSGGTVGFPEISAAAAELEEAEDEQIPPRLESFLTLLHQVTIDDEHRFGILIIEDDPLASRILQVRLAANNREIFAAETGAQAEEILQNEEIDLILLDLILPDTDGRNLLTKLRARPDMAGLPVIVVSIKGSRAAKTECFALGADEYFEKPIDTEILATAVAAKLKRSGEIARESRTDPLTGLANRAAFAEAFQRAQSLATRSRDRLSLAILDLDRFKSINDTYGHMMGDEVLRRIRPVTDEALRKTDFVARWGGEEFVVLFPKADTRGAARGLEKALEAFRREKFQVEGRTVSQVTFSAGVTEVSEQASVEESVAEADRLLYMAKEGGRNQILTQETEIPSKGKKVLLAEDDDIVASVVKHRMGREGFEVIHFPDGITALKGAVETDVSLAILDVKMPGMDGFELLGKLRKMPSYKTIPIVMLTSMGSEKDIVRGFELGADDYIMKPFSPVELVARLRRLIKEPVPSEHQGGPKILLVDDDPVILMTATKSLEKTGDFQVLQAHNAGEAIERARQEHPNVILTDLFLPDKDGTALLDQLLYDDTLSNIPVIFLTAKTDPSLVAELVSHGAKGVISKPFDPLKLPDQLKEILNKEKT